MAFQSPDWSDGCLLFALGTSAGQWDAELNPREKIEDDPFLPWDEMDVDEKRAYFALPLTLGFAGLFVLFVAFLAPDPSFGWKVIGCALAIIGLAAFLAYRRWKRRFGV